ncbi:hypothetical protein [Paractinoplanes toevensis]|uniref:Uncharacterized protein n=1 Tax=Paractinoplanes toevensis TaxID=571911 RepID=A0A919TEA1_9ACTN|nr:hypothetical protein [Actinoplanes toevensis]GIM94404.1 hypothetical protein Ato02nite_061970 [Actinoplanes toevensis]
MLTEAITALTYVEASLVASTSGGYSVHHQGVYVGYIHIRCDGQWGAYVRRVGKKADHLGTFGQEQAVLCILGAFCDSPARTVA